MENVTKNLIIYSIGIISLVGIVALVMMVGEDNKGPVSSIYSANIFTVVEKSFDFGTISMKNGNVSHKFEIRNEGTEMVRIEKVYTSCMCTTAFIVDGSGKKHGGFGMHSRGALIEVGAGEVIILEAVFDPAAHGPSGVGLAQRSIYVETDSAKSPKLELSFQAMVTR